MLIVEDNKTKRLHTIPEVAELLEVSRATVDREIKLGRLEAVRIRGRVFVRVEDLNEYIIRLTY